MDSGRKEILGQSSGHNSRIQKKKSNHSAEQCLPSTSKDLNQERKQSQSGMKSSQMSCSIGKVHRMLKDNNLMFPIYLRLLTDTRTLINQTMVHYTKANMLINLVGLELYRSSYLEILVSTSSLSALQSDPIIWAAYMRGREDADSITKTLTTEPQSVSAAMQSTSNIETFSHLTAFNPDRFYQVGMLQKLKDHFEELQQLTRRERKLLKAARHGLTLMNSENNN